MSDNIAEQAEEKSASKIGKFNTAEDLLAAYNALESEFTKRCQLVKQLQTELNALRAQAEQTERHNMPPEAEPTEQAAQPPADDTQPVPEADGGRDDSAATVELVPPAITADDVLNEILQNACDYAERLSAIPEVMSACIASYKQRLIQPHPAAAPAGMAVIVPAQKPRTLSEAKRLADAILAGN